MNKLYKATADRLRLRLGTRHSGALKRTILLSCLLFNSILLFAQDQKKEQTPPPPLPVREISGIVKDTTDLGVIGATVSLTSDKDTLKTSTNADGIFIFKNVKSATYTLLVQSIGYTASKPTRYKQNDAVARIIMDPIVLKEEKNVLNEVVINGTPSITYKTDTVEYRASDYIVRKNATVDELLKKMEGMEVGTDGSLIHQGQPVVRAKLNGKEYLGGDLANAIKNLPAEIVEKIQIVDDYGDQAARTGIKDGDPEKILNITTRTDKSVGNMARINGGVGNNDRYDAGVFGTRVNQDQTVGVNGQFNNTVNGVAGGGGGDNGGGGGGGGRGGNNNNQGSGGGGGSGGTTNSGNGSVSYRDKIGKKIEFNLNYDYRATDVESFTNSTAERFYINRDELGNPLGTETTFETRMGLSNNNSKNHNFKFEFEANLDSANFLRIIPTIKYSSTSSSRIDTVYQTGANNQDQFTNNTSTNTRPQLGASIFYQHVFKKPRRNFSFQVDLNSNNQEADQQQYSKFIYHDKADTEDILDRIVARKNLQDNYRGSMTYVEPLTLNTQLELNAQVNYNGYDNTATTRNVDASGTSSIIDSLSNIYDYSFTQGRIALNYRYGLNNTSKVRFSLGVTAVPSLLSGTKVSLGTSTNRTSFNLIPIARFEYLWSRQHKLQLSYSGNAVEPTFDQIQPVRDVSSPKNPVIGNPDLDATFVHSIKADYDNYIANSKLNYSVNINGSMTENAVIRNVTRIQDPDAPGPDPLNPDVITNGINETRFLNTDGVYKIGGNYSISKQLNDRKYNLSFSGSANFDHRITMSANVKNITNIWTLTERVGPRINPTEWFEINPNISYNHTKSSNSTIKEADNKTNTLAFNLDGRVYVWDTYLFGYSASKNYVSGINANVTSNPFVINLYLEKEFMDRKAKLTLQAFDLLNQNNFVNRDVSDNAIVDTKSNALSRYFMLRLSIRLQKWSGAKGRNGRGIMRRGDGSFM